MKTSKPILYQLPLLIAAIAVVIVVTWLTAWQYVQQSLIRTAGEALTLGAAEIALRFDRMIFERYGDMRVMAAVISDRIKDDPAFVQRYVNTVRDTYRAYHWVAVADREGRLVGSTSAESPPGTDVSRTPWFEEVRVRVAGRPDVTVLEGVEAFLTEEGAPDAIASPGLSMIRVVPLPSWSRAASPSRSWKRLSWKRSPVCRTEIPH